MPGSKELKRRAHKRRNGKRSSESHRKELERHRRNYRARRQQECLEAIDARAAAGATAEKGTAGTAPLSEESKHPEPTQVSLKGMHFHWIAIGGVYTLLVGPTAWRSAGRWG